MPKSIPYDGYQAAGADAIRIQWRGDHFGPGIPDGNYQAGGYNMNASAFGMQRIEEAAVSYRTQSGNYYAAVFYPASSGNNEIRAVPPSYVTLKWFNAANSVEVANNTNLSAEVTYLRVVGV
jgi:hypothetical protein